MAFRVSRREFFGGLGKAASSVFLTTLFPRTLLASEVMSLGSSPFRIAVINDEISQDFGHACEMASQQFGMRWIELRSMWDKNVLKLSSQEISEAKRILRKYELEVTDIGSPLFKVDWPNAPRSKFSPKRDQFNADFTFDQQDEVLERSIHLAKEFGTDRVRCFDFWRLDNQAPYRSAINDKLRDASKKAAKNGVILILENEMACNTATGVEAATVLSAVRSKSFMLNWDPGNAAAHGETPYPDGYNLLPRDRIGHCHCKDVVKKGQAYEWAAMGHGTIDWVGQFKALKQDGYHFAVSLETHWRGAGTEEASTKESWAGMRDQLHKAEAL